MSIAELLFWASGLLIFSEAVYLLSRARLRIDAAAGVLFLTNWAFLAAGLALYLSDEFMHFRGGEVVFGIAAAYVPSTWLVFTSYWGRDLESQSLGNGLKLAMLASFIFSTLFAIGATVEAILLYHPGPLSTAHLSLGAYSFLLILFYLTSFLFGLYNIENTYRTALGSQRRRLRAGAVILGILTGAVLFAGTVELLFDRVPLWELLATAVAVPILCLFLVVHLVKNDPAELGVVVTRRSSYSSIVIIAGGLYFLLVGMLAQVITATGLSPDILVPTTALALVLVFFMSIYMLNLAQRRTRVGHSDIDSKHMSDFASFLDSITVSTVAEEIFERVRVFLRTNYGINRSVFIEKSDSAGYHLIHLDDSLRIAPIRKIASFVEWVHRFSRPIIFGDLVERTDGEDIGCLRLEETLGYQPELIVPVIGRQALVGVLVTAPSESGTKEVHELSQFLETVSGPLALAIHNARVTEQLLKAKEMESFHKISSFVLHDLKNSVGMLDLLMSNARKNIDNPEFRESMFGTIEDAVTRQRRIIAKLTDTSEAGTIAMSDMDVNRVVQAAVEKTQVAKIGRINLTEEYGDVPTIKGNPQKFGSVLENLIVNAIEAMPVKGDLLVATGLVDADNGKKRAVVQVRDTGVGMSADFLLSKLFRPFTSTKKKGLGIGMYQSREVMRQMGGDIVVESEQGKGSCFTVELPVQS